MDRHERVDAKRFPNFAALARTSTWYHSATTVQWLTEVAVPAILTGILPNPHKKLLPIYSDHPNNVFTLLGGSYRERAVESITHMCPSSICKQVKGQPSAQEVQGTTGSLANDAGVVYLHLLLPSPYVDEVPQISDSWGNFGQAEHSEVSTTHTGPILPCARNVCRFTASLAKDGKPTFYMIHSLLPHVPYLYLPSERAYGIEVPLLRGVRQGVWQQVFPALQSEQRYLLQTEYTDRALGYMMRRLKADGIFDKALVIVLADHGVSFRHEAPRRLPTPRNMQDIAFVPMFVKLPHQRRGRIDDGLARTVDIVPTIAKVLHIKVPYHVDGKPLVGRKLPQDGTVKILIGNGRYATARLSDLQALRRQALAEQLATFGTTPADLYRIGPHRGLLGRLVSGLRVHPSSSSVQLQNENLLRTVDTRSGLLPTWIQGTISGAQPNEDLAVAVNGRISAVTQSYDQGGVTRFDAMVPDGSLHDARNDVSVFAVQADGSLDELKGSSVTTTLKTRGGVQVISSSGGRAIPVRPQALSGQVRVKVGQNYDFDGSATDASKKHKVDMVMVFVDGEQVYASKASLIQPKSGLGQVAKQNPYGFRFDLPASLLPKPGSGHKVRVFAVRGGVASELRYRGSYPWSH
jgi:Sulfatase